MSLSLAGERLMRDPGSQLESLIEELLSSAQLQVFENVRWTLRDGYLVSTLKVQHPDHEDLRLELRKNPRLSKFSFQLSVRSKPARRFCSLKPHINPPDCSAMPNQPFRGQHKHRWSDLTGDECVYVPEDFTAYPLEDAFHSFCEECGIEFHGIWNDPPLTQMGFETVA